MDLQGICAVESLMFNFAVDAVPMDERQEYPTVASFTLFKENSNHLHGIIIAYYTTLDNIKIQKY